MDLKSMLNDSSSHRPPPQTHTSQASFDRAAEQSLNYIAQSERPIPRYTSLTPSSSQSPPGGGSYFSVQSPRNSHSANTPNVVTPSGLIQSPGTYGKSYLTRETLPSQYSQNTSVSTPRPQSTQQPVTPGAYPRQSSTPISLGPSYVQGGPTVPHRHSAWDETTSSNGSLLAQPQYSSPRAQFHAPPVTPLGPPLSHPRPSPQAHRPQSSGYGSFRRSSIGSVGSSHSRDYPSSQVGHVDQPRPDSIIRTYTTEEDRVRERERSIESVSPKTIPRATPQRQLSGNLQQYHSEPQQVHPSNLRQGLPPISQTTPERAVERHDSVTQKPPATLTDIRPNSSISSAKPNSITPTGNNMTPRSTHASLPTQKSPMMEKRPDLKRNASVISNTSVSSLPPRKRLKRHEIPIFAQSARLSKPLRLKNTSLANRSLKSEIRPRSELPEPKMTNGNTLPKAPDGPRWEPSILNITPYEDLTRRICDWIVQTIGMATPPSGGGVFEIEAKVGAIIDTEAGERLNLPVETETVFSKEKFRRTAFESTMNMAQHKQLNTFLNGLVQQSFAEAQTSDREIIRFDHPKESDEFFDLTAEGRRNLQPSIQQWLNPRHKPRVRRTIDKQTGALKAQLIKTRIADLEVYNPAADFDYRISISLESPWEGDPQWLSQITDAGRDRNKDRMSYRHMAYQIDLTQVSYSSSPKLEHELEVEISTEQIRLELENLRMSRPNKYEDLVRGFIDNVRILCRRGTVGKTS